MLSTTKVVLSFGQGVWQNLYSHSFDLQDRAQYGPLRAASKCMPVISDICRIPLFVQTHSTCLWSLS